MEGRPPKGFLTLTTSLHISISLKEGEEICYKESLNSIISKPICHCFIFYSMLKDIHINFYNMISKVEKAHLG